MSAEFGLAVPTGHCVNHWHLFTACLSELSSSVAICGGLISFKDFAAVVTRTTPRCSCVRGWRRSRCRWDGTSSLSAPWPPPELPPRTEHRVALFSRHKDTQLVTVRRERWRVAHSETNNLRWRPWARCDGGSPGSPSWPKRSECLRSWVWSWSGRTEEPPRRNRCSNRCRYERCEPRSAYQENVWLAVLSLLFGL